MFTEYSIIVSAAHCLWVLAMKYLRRSAFVGSSFEVFA